ncbi:MAG TPA: glycosyltransferase family 2 protein, partial [Dongiaceae bacterium]
MKPRSIVRSLVRMARRPLHRRPRIVMTLLCRDEEDIIGYNIAYHLAQGVDFVIATDNASGDRTPAVLERFVRQGTLHLIHEPRLTHDQGVWVTRMAQMAARRFGADWVINNDADEFWISREGTLRTALAVVPGDVACLAVPRSDMLPARDARQPFFEAMLIRLAGNESVHGTNQQSKACHRADPVVQVADGNHYVKAHGKRLVERSDHPLQILHFPLRSAAQLERKVRQGAEALHANPRVEPSIGRHWRKLYRDYLLHGQLADYYHACAPISEQIAAGLAGGRFIQDIRMRDALRQL